MTKLVRIYVDFVFYTKSLLASVVWILMGHITRWVPSTLATRSSMWNMVREIRSSNFQDKKKIFISTSFSAKEKQRKTLRHLLQYIEIYFWIYLPMFSPSYTVSSCPRPAHRFKSGFLNWGCENVHFWGSGRINSLFLVIVRGWGLWELPFLLKEVLDSKRIKNHYFRLSPHRVFGFVHLPAHSKEREISVVIFPRYFSKNTYDIICTTWESPRFGREAKKWGEGEINCGPWPLE